jgi:hypothetical protein
MARRLAKSLGFSWLLRRLRSASSRILSIFGWKLANLQKKKLSFMDAQPGPDLIQSGNFDLSGMLAALEAKTKEMKRGASCSMRFMLC